MAQKDKSALQSESTSLFPDNNAQEITPARKRSFDTDMIDSGLNLAELTQQDIQGAIRLLSNLLVDFTASGDDDDWQNIDINADGGTSISVQDVHYETGAMPNGASSALYNINIDGVAALGGSLAGLFFNLANAGSLSGVTAMAVGSGIRPLIQLRSTAAALTVGEVDGVNELADLTNPAVNTDVFVSNSDTLVFGASALFDDLTVVLDTGASKSLNLTWEFSTGVGTWTAFTPGGDSTNNFQSSGLVYWGSGGLSGWATSGGNYLIRATRVANGVSTTPIVKELDIDEASFYTWDKDGGIEAGTLNLDNIKQGAGAEPVGMAVGEVWSDSTTTIGNSYALYIATVAT